MGWFDRLLNYHPGFRRYLYGLARFKPRHRHNYLISDIFIHSLIEQTDFLYIFAKDYIKLVSFIQLMKTAYEKSDYYDSFRPAYQLNGIGGEP